MKKSTTKRALLMSVLSMFLCFTMLIGTTFAWFTDEVESGVNTIIAGNLDVELYNGDKQITGEDTDPAFFDDVAAGKWEPGAMAWETFTVKNVGNLALKYKLTFKVEEPTEGVSLAKALRIAVVDGAPLANVTGRIDPADYEWQAFEEFTLTGELDLTSDAEKEDVRTFIVWWEPSDNDNDYNMNNGNQGKKASVAFYLDLFATQLEAEMDSFGDDYDAGAPWTGEANVNWYDPAETEYVLDSADELAGLAALVNGTAASSYSMRSTAIADSFAGKTIKLGANVDMNGLNWTPIGNWDNAFAGTFDGQGYTISNLKINDPEGDGVGFFGITEKVTIKNVNFVNVDVYGYSEVATVAGYVSPGSTISNCHVSGKISIVAEYAYAGGISAGQAYYSVDGCSVIADGTGLIQAKNRNAVGGIAAWMCEGENKITNCQVKNLDLIGWTNIGGISGFIHYSNVIDGCTVENVDIVKTREGGNPGFGAIAGGYSYNANKPSTITNNTAKNVTMTGASLPYEKASKLYGSEYGGATTANFVLENNIEENVVENNLVVNKFVANATELQAALDAATGEYVIYVTGDIAGDVTATQKPDVKITVYGNDHEFNGVFTVNGKSARYETAAITIKGFNFKADTLSADAFIRLGGDNSMRYTHGVTVEDCTFTGNGFVAVKSYTGGDWNVTLDGLTVNAGMHSLAQLTNVEKGLTITDCKVYSKNGANLNNTLSLNMSDCTFDVTGYAVRFGTNGTVNAEEKSFAITNSTLKSACDDGDAVVIFRDSSTVATLDLTGTTLVGSLTFKGNTASTTIIGQ